MLYFAKAQLLFASCFITTQDNYAWILSFFFIPVGICLRWSLLLRALVGQTGDCCYLTIQVEGSSHALRAGASLHRCSLFRGRAVQRLLYQQRRKLLNHLQRLCGLLWMPVGNHLHSRIPVPVGQRCFQLQLGYAESLRDICIRHPAVFHLHLEPALPSLVSYLCSGG